MVLTGNQDLRQRHEQGLGQPEQRRKLCQLAEYKPGCTKNERHSGNGKISDQDTSRRNEL
jgi:hypothetical protein